jgi:PKD repeat protein
MRATTLRISVGAIFVILAVALSAGQAHASDSYLADFTNMYPNSATSNAGCQVCHVNASASPTTRNVYGAAWATNGHNFSNVEALNSDGVGGTNLAEITAGAQPGWCVQTTAGCLQTAGTPPSGLLDNAASANQPPVLAAIGAKSVNENQLLTFTATATDPNVGNTLTFSAGNLPTGATLNATTGVFNWTPTFTQAGNYNVTITVTDNGSPAASDFETFTITVGNVNRPPVLSPSPIGDRTVSEGQTLTIPITASDPDGGALTFTSANLPTGATLTPTGTGAATFSWTPSFTQAGSFPNVTLTVSDGALTDAEVFTITVGNVNRPPVLNLIGAKTATVGQPFTFTATATDPDAGSALTFSAGNLPTGATLNATTGVFNWTPTATGTSSVTVTVTDNGSPAQNDFEVVTITVGTSTNVNRPPVLNPIGAKTINEGQTLAFTATATDPDGGALTFSGGSLPSGPALTPAGAFSWTPDFTQAGTYNVTITVTDNGGLTDSETFTITVGNINRPPVLSPSPIGNRTVTIGQTLTIAITASDPDGGALSFTSANLPSGALLTPTGTGAATFSWTPATGQAGTYQNVTITVSDGALTDAEVFTITVQASTPTPVCAMTVSPTALAFGSVNVGGSKTMTTTIGNNGTANCTVSSRTVRGAGFALGSGAPSVPITIAPGANVSVPVNFAPTVAGAASGSLTIGSAVVSLSGTGEAVTAPPPSTAGLDYKIRSFTATEEVRMRSTTPVTFRLSVKNVGTVSGSVPATLVGLQNGVEVYRRTMQVSAPVGTTTTLGFQPYTPTRGGEIGWTVTIQDAGSQGNVATDRTEVERSGERRTSRERRRTSD